MPKAKEPSKQEQKTAEVEKKITAAIGNTNQEQVDRRNAIADRADEFRAADLQDTDGDRVVERDPEEARAEAEAQATEAERARLEAEANEAEAKRLQEESGRSEPVSKTYSIKVNGRDVQMTEEELLARASKVASADEYLQMAADAVKRSTALVPSQDVPASDGSAVTEDTLTSALQGDREALRKVAQRLNGPSVNPDVLQAVDDRLTFHDAVNWFRGEYKDVVTDPFLYQLVVDQDKRIASSEPTLPYRDRLKKAGDTIRNWKQGFTKTSDTNAKLARKAATPPVPAAGSRQSVREDEEAEEPVESVIDAIAKSRGQEQAIRTPQGMFGKS
jgi:hypothetical protein